MNMKSMLLICACLLARGYAVAEEVPASSGKGSAIASIEVQVEAGAGAASFDGVVQAVRQASIAAQVAGTVREVKVHPGQRVRAGDVLVRLDAQASEQGVAASDAHLAAAQAALEVATRDFERQRQLHEKEYISDGAFERAQAQYRSAQAQAQVQQAQAGASRAQRGYFVLTAPFAGVVAEVPAVQGDMAMPGRPLVVLYDPSAMRVSSMVPQSALPRHLGTADVGIESEPATGPIPPASVEVIPAADPATHTVEVRVGLAHPDAALVPGSFARLTLNGTASSTASGASRRFFVPLQSIVRRTEMTGVYVVDAAGRAQLRQVRTGEASADRIEVLSGLEPGDRVATHPTALTHAAR